MGFLNTLFNIATDVLSFRPAPTPDIVARFEMEYSKLTDEELEKENERIEGGPPLPSWEYQSRRIALMNVATERNQAGSHIKWGNKSP